MFRKALFTLTTGVSMALAAIAWPSTAYAQLTYSAAYPNSANLSGMVRVIARPRQANVYVDGFFAGVVDDFNGATQRLPATPGEHTVTLYLEGYRTITRHVTVKSGATVKLQATMDRLGPDQTSELPPAAALQKLLPGSNLGGPPTFPRN